MVFGWAALVSLLISGCYCGFALFWAVGFAWGFLVSGLGAGAVLFLISLVFWFCVVCIIYIVGDFLGI